MKRPLSSGFLVAALMIVSQSCVAQTEQSKEAPVQRKPYRFEIEGGWSDWGLHGNRNKLRQYATPPRGFFLRDLSLGLADDRRNDARFVLKAPGQDDYRVGGMLRLNGGTTKVFAADFRNRFFDPNPDVVNGSQRRVSEAYVWQKITPQFAVSARTRLNNEDQNLDPGIDPLHQSTRVTNGTARGSLWNRGFVDLSITETRYHDRTAALPDSTTDRMSASVMQQVGDNLALSGSLSHALVKQELMANSKVDEWSVGGNMLVTDDTNLLLNYRNERLSLPTNLQAYDRSRQQLRARVVHRLGNGWSTQLGYNQLALERVRDDHAFVDVPRFHTFDFEVNGRLNRFSRLTAKLSREMVQGSALMQTVDQRALYWTSRWDGQLKLTTGNPISDAYVVFDWHENRNSQRDVTVRHQGLTVGVETNPVPAIEFYSEISSDLWSGRTSDPLSPDLNQFFPDATTFTLGANWTIDKRAWATANYTLANTENPNPLSLPGGNVWGSYFTGSLHYKVSADTEFGLTVAPWQYVDHFAPAFGYNTGLIQVTAKAKF